MYLAVIRQCCLHNLPLLNYNLSKHLLQEANQKKQVYKLYLIALMKFINRKITYN